MNSSLLLFPRLFNFSVLSSIMFTILREFDLTFARHLFQRNFHSSENSYFKDAWNKRTREHSYGLWSKGHLLGMAIVCGKKLEYICVDPDHQGKGWGTKLLHHVMDQCPNLYLHPADDPALCQWYERQGFQLSNEIDYPEYTKRCYVRHAYSTRSKSAGLKA